MGFGGRWMSLADVYRGVITQKHQPTGYPASHQASSMAYTNRHRHDAHAEPVPEPGDKLLASVSFSVCVCESVSVWEQADVQCVPCEHTVRTTHIFRIRVGCPVVLASLAVVQLGFGLDWIGFVNADAVRFGGGQIGFWFIPVVAGRQAIAIRAPSKTTNVYYRCKINEELHRE